jgi:hypothetical protein
MNSCTVLDLPIIDNAVITSTVANTTTNIRSFSPRNKLQRRTGARRAVTTMLEMAKRAMIELCGVLKIKTFESREMDLSGPWLLLVHRYSGKRFDEVWQHQESFRKLRTILELPNTEMIRSSIQCSNASTSDSFSGPSVIKSRSRFKYSRSLREIQALFLRKFLRLWIPRRGALLSANMSFPRLTKASIDHQHLC